MTFEPVHDDVMKLLWKAVDEERHERIEAAVEEMLTDEQARGVRVIESYFGRLIDVRLDPDVPFGTILIVRKADHLDGIVSPSERSGGKT